MAKGTSNSKTGVIREFLDIIDKYGYLKIICATVLMVFVSFFTYIAFNPSIYFEKYQEYEEQRHNSSNTYRMETSPQVRSYLNALAVETGANRAFIAEFHNGKNNPSGLQWQYADMNFIDDNGEDVRDQFQNVSLVKYPLGYELYKDGTWCGPRTKVDEKDHRLALRLEADDVVHVGASMMYGQNLVEIGFVGVSFTDSTKTVDDVKLGQILRKYASNIAPLLDGAKAKDNKNE